ncbi:MAG: hypothetical protein LBR17_08345 [Bacteroidales bacterium]|nr:hypothetical protein [Bacteroidales bacterium]
MDKSFFLIILLLLASQVTFAQPPHPSGGSNPTNNTGRPIRSVNEPVETPVATTTTLLLVVAGGYGLYKINKQRIKK